MFDVRDLGAGVPDAGKGGDGEHRHQPAGDVDQAVVEVVADDELGAGEGAAGDEEGGPDVPDVAEFALGEADLDDRHPDGDDQGEKGELAGGHFGEQLGLDAGNAFEGVDRGAQGAVGDGG